MPDLPVTLYHARLVRFAIWHLRDQLTPRKEELANPDIRRSSSNPEADEDERVAEETGEIGRSIRRDIHAFSEIHSAIGFARFPDDELNRLLTDVLREAETLGETTKERRDREQLNHELDEFVKRLLDLQGDIDRTIRELEERDPSGLDGPWPQQPPVSPSPSGNVVTTIRFLLLADLHWGQEGDSDHFPTVQKAFFDAFETISKEGWKPDLMLFAGDYVNKGRQDAFTDELPKVLNPLWEKFHMLDWSPMLVAVPGNHDLQRPTEKAQKTNAKALLEQWGSKTTQRQFWDDDHHSYRELITEVFGPYRDWWKARRRSSKIRTPNVRNHAYSEGLLPGDFSCCYKQSHNQGRKMRLGIVALNSAFLQLLEENELPDVFAKDYREHLSLHVRQFNTACDPKGLDGPGWANKQDAVLLLTHHSLDWLEKSAQKRLLQRIYFPGDFLAHVHGHMHEEEFGGRSSGGQSSYCNLQAPALYAEDKYYDSDRQEHVRDKHGFILGEIRFTETDVSLHISPRVLSDDKRRVVVPGMGTIALKSGDWAEVNRMPLKKPLR